MGFQSQPTGYLWILLVCSPSPFDIRTELEPSHNPPTTSSALAQTLSTTPQNPAIASHVDKTCVLEGDHKQGKEQEDPGGPGADSNDDDVRSN
ncbi:hypothetical protein PILCRDRAFT_14875 [Piloderma croceum F 1598]|uniref:Uncharacterized protein n=1 Tax=Piloderma croceum (strain F 1598) TaxID=765440 RepID=A0A0C3EMR6_PILCF|nr:hypothetical protein PILCRDRAFT_14875 [Piloderma croceum F 1598]